MSLGIIQTIFINYIQTLYKNNQISASMRKKQADLTNDVVLAVKMQLDINSHRKSVLVN